MKQFLPRGSRRSIRTRVLAIVLVPSVTLVAIGVGASAYMVHRGVTARDWATKVATANVSTVAFFGLIQEERRLSLLRLAGDRVDSAGLEEVRPAADAALAQLGTLTRVLSDLNPGATAAASDAFNKAFGNLPATRTAVDAGTTTPEVVYAFYNGLSQVLSIGLLGVMQTAQDPTSAVQVYAALDMIGVAESMSRSNALAAASVAGGGFTARNLGEFTSVVNYYHVQLQTVTPALLPHGQAQYGKLVSSAAFKRLSAVETALISRGPKPGMANDARPLPETFTEWQRDAQQVSDQMQAMWADQFRLAEQGAGDRGHATFVRWLIAGIAVLLVAAIALGIAIQLANILVRRLKRLRADTLELADERLPKVVENLRNGQPVNLATDVPDLEYGTDEVGQVADAFNKAQRTAVAAAQQEAQAREGMSAVFLNIAHRSQMVAHRQLEVLDEAERRQEDPQHLEMLFRIDHLATRARRNAENLVILGGERPGRKWRKPVPLDEIARGAVSETENFARVTTVRIPDVMMEGGMVADLIHLLAELVDNATSFSPPGTRVEMRGNMVGRGVVIEVEDQGLGMTAAQRDRLNAMLADPPDFQMMALTRQMRLGLFVVAQLAARHSIRVTLAESAYGGTRAIVLIPSAPSGAPAIAPESAPAVPELPTLTGHQRQLYAPSRQLRSATLNGNGNGSGHHEDGEPALNGPEWAPAELARSEYLAPATPEEVPDQQPVSTPPVEGDLFHPGPVGPEMTYPDGVHRPAPNGYQDNSYQDHGYGDNAYGDGAYRDNAYRNQVDDYRPDGTYQNRDAFRPDAARRDTVRPDPVPPPSMRPQPLVVRPDPLHTQQPAGNGVPSNGAQSGGTQSGGAQTSGAQSGGAQTSGVPANGSGQPHVGQHRGAGRAPLPRRRRQANLAPQLAAEMEPDAMPPAEPARSPEQARDTMSAVLRGTRQGRGAPPERQ